MRLPFGIGACHDSLMGFRIHSRAAVAAALAGALAVGFGFAACSASSDNAYQEEYDAGRRTRDGGELPGFDGSPVTTADGGVSCAVTPCATDLAVGGEYACVILSGGKVACWGANRVGQLGRDTLPNAAIKSAIALEVPNLSDVIALTAGWYHACAMKSDHTVWCWGNASDGQTGGGISDQQPTPLKVNGLPGDVAAVVAGGRHTCARTAGGRVFCWGNNNEGQVGQPVQDGGTVANRISAPVEVQGITAEDVVTGDRTTCFLESNTSLQCVGQNTDGQLGRGSSDFGKYSTPAPVVGITGTIQKAIKSGGYHHMLLLDDDTIMAWGPNGEGQLGLPAQSEVTSPAKIDGITNVKLVAPGTYFSCIALGSGKAQCFGRNTKGQLGQAAGASTNLPVDVSLPGPVHRLGAGLRDFACALLTDGSVHCWGSNVDGQLGRNDEALPDDFKPAPVVFQ